MRDSDCLSEDLDDSGNRSLQFITVAADLVGGEINVEDDILRPWVSVQRN
jgi:hypothetical protein